MIQTTFGRVACIALACAACNFRGTAGGGLDDAVDTADVAIDAPITSAHLFVADYIAGAVHHFVVERDSVMPTSASAMPLTTAVTPVVSPSGELLVGQRTVATIQRFTSPFDTPTPAGTIAMNGLSAELGSLLVVDGNLWVSNPGASNVIVLSLADAPTKLAEFTAVAVRGLHFDATRGELFATQCCGVDTILRSSVSGIVAESRPGIAQDGQLANPHGMVTTPWGELLVANGVNPGSIVRYALGDATTAPLFVERYAHADLSVPIDLQLAPWGELFVTNQGTGVIARYTFDPATHALVPRGTFPVNAASGGVVWATLVVAP